MSEERLQILKMVESGKLSAEEAAKLLEAVDSSPPGARARTIKIRVTEPNRKVNNISVSLGMADWLIRWFGNWLHVDIGGSELDVAKLREAIREGRPGKAMEVEEDGRRVEVWLE